MIYAEIDRVCDQEIIRQIVGVITDDGAIFRAIVESVMRFFG